MTRIRRACSPSRFASRAADLVFAPHSKLVHKKGEITMHHGKRWLLLGLVVSSVLLLTGCVKETVDGDKHIYTYELWAPLLILVVGLAAVPAGWFLRNNRFGWALMILGPIAALGFAPTLFLERTTVDPQGFHVKTGIWGMTAAHQVRFDDLQTIRLTKEISRGRRGRKNTNYYMVCCRKDGTEAKVPLGNSLVEKAIDQIKIGIDAHSINVVDETGGE
jgi:hypothetical protein